MELTDAERHFFTHGGWSYKTGTETPEEGHIRSARELAAAEKWARENGYKFSWEPDSDGDAGDEVASMYNPDGEMVESLCAISDASPEYRRVVEAELALEQQRR